jgi:hypothetical protein
MSQKRRERQYPLDQPPNGMVVEPALPNRNPMTPSQTSVNNSLAGSDDENLPPVTDSQGNPLPLTEFGGMDNYAEEPVPTEVRQAAANIPETGVLFNLAPFEQIAQLHAAGQKDEARKVYNSLNDQAKYVYNNARNMERFTAQEGARLADEFRQMRDRQAMQDQGPQAKAIEIAQAEKAQKTVEMSNDILSIMDRLRGFKKGEKDSEKKTPKYFGRVGTFDSLMPAATSGDRAGWYIDHKTLEDTLALAEAQANRGQGNFTETERLMLRSAATGGLNYGRDDASYAQIFEGMYDMLKKKAEQQAPLTGPGSGSAATAPAAAAQTKTIGNQTWIRTADGWLPQR